MERSALRETVVFVVIVVVLFMIAWAIYSAMEGYEDRNTGYQGAGLLRSGVIQA
jgi:hypothetical protein